MACFGRSETDGRRTGVWERREALTQRAVAQLTLLFGVLVFVAGRQASTQGGGWWSTAGSWGGGSTGWLVDGIKLVLWQKSESRAPGQARSKQASIELDVQVGYLQLVSSLYTTTPAP
jgi:hypothetical protein